MSVARGEHIVVIGPDDRGRFPLKKYIHPAPVTGWRLYRENDGKTITLEAIEDAKEME